MDMYYRGAIDREIADSVGVTKCTIWRWRKKRGLTSNSITRRGERVGKDETEEIAKLRLQGMGIAEIAKVLGRATLTVERQLSKVGLTGYRKYSALQTAILEEWMKDRVQDYSQIAAHLHTSRERVTQIIGRYLMEQCRLDDSCPLKALLPEYNESNPELEQGGIQ